MQCNYLSHHLETYDDENEKKIYKYGLCMFKEPFLTFKPKNFF